MRPNRVLLQPKTLVTAGLVGLIVVVLYLGHGTQDITLSNVLVWQAQMAQLFLDMPVFFSLVYFVVFTSITALCLPGASVLMLACGGCMSFVLCCLLSTGASALGALITMMLTRYGLRETTEAKYGKQLSQINRGLNKNPVLYLLSLRLAPVIPFVLFNVLAGLTRVKPRTFLWTSFVGMLPSTALYVHAGAQAATAQELTDLLSVEMMVALCALAVVPWLLQWLFKPMVTAAKADS